ncbi:MAG TPA: ankyrin repeat domain-containing protein, partial [Steroidobacteraceae bacterium]|nr:ankyrin repeat domain-containing protein [Steroidobacteraceae bacterium]
GRGDLSAVTVLLESGVNPDTPSSGRTAIVAASMGGHLDVVKALLAAGADTETGATTATGSNTALIWALVNGHTAVARALVEAGANLRVAREYGSPALVYAAAGNDPDSLAIVQGMIAAGLDLQPGLLAAVHSGSVEIVKVLLAAGARADFRLAKGFTPLPAPRLLRLLRDGVPLPRGESIPPGGDTLLMLAAARGRADVMRALLAAGADANAKRNDGGTALMAAVANIRAEAVQVLLTAKADVNAVDNNGSTALMLAVPDSQMASPLNIPSSEIARMLQEAESKVQGIRYAPVTLRSTRGGLASDRILYPAATDIVRMLLGAGADPAIRRSDDRTAAMLAREANLADMSKLLDPAVAALPAAN